MPLGRAASILARLVLTIAACAMVPPARAEQGFDFESVCEKARKLALMPFREAKGQVPEWLEKLNYDQWRDIRFRPESSLWKERPSPFQVQFFHPGLFYDKTVAVNVVEGNVARPVEFNPNHFDYGRNEFASAVPQNLGYAGFRLHSTFKTKDYFDEVIVFLGASYFRAVGRDQVFGLSARGLAIDTAESRGEEFPRFTEFWLVSPVPAPKPVPPFKGKSKDKDAKSAAPAAPSTPAKTSGAAPGNATEVTVFALLDSASVTGAYRFVITPGDQTAVKVDSRLFFRNEVRKLGIAPLTSMFFHGENTTRRFDDFRPEAHDSDGLSLAMSNGEWVWRPLENPKDLRVSSFQMENPVGFGLLQRDRNFDHYQDLETRFEQRPSVWIEPNGSWGAGRVELVEIPTNSEYNDNVVAYWVSNMPTKPGAMLPFSYTMYWHGEDPVRRPEGRATATLRDNGGKDEIRRFVIDFEGKKLSEIPAERVLHGVVSVSGGSDAAEVVEQHVVKNHVTGGWRLTFQLKIKRRGPLDLRAFLDEKGETLTETWTYLLQP